MTNSEKKLVIEFLKQFSEVLNNRVCNDFHLEEIIPDAVERRRLILEYHQFQGDVEEFNPVNDYKYFVDYYLVDLLIHKLEQELNNEST